MTFEELKTKMESLGFKYQPESRSGAYDTVVGIFYRRTGDVRRECLTNEGKLQLVATLYDRARYENLRVQDLPHRFSFEVDITGEYVKDLWAKLRVYGVQPEQLFEKHKEIESALVRAWEALA